VALLAAVKGFLHILHFWRCFDQPQPTDPMPNYSDSKPARRVIGFLCRYWLLLLLCVAFLLITTSDKLFILLGTAIYAPFGVTLAALCGLLLRNVFNHETTDADADSGLYVDQWRALSPQQRFTFTFWQWIAYFLGACLIVAALLK